MKLILYIVLLSWSLLHPTFAGPRFLAISDIHYGANNASRDGEDTGPEFFKIAMKKFQKLSLDADFILFLGDMPTHSLFKKKLKQEYERTVFAQLLAHDISDKPMFYIPGNNDSLLGNYQPFSSNNESPLNEAKNWSGACIHCSGLIIDKSHMYSDGYYSSYVIPKNRKIILIALNATQWTRTPLFSRYANQKQDALKQLAWFAEQLKQHHADQLIIAMHEPPGNSYKGKPIWHKPYLDQFIKVISQYQSLYKEITLLTSHSHMDELRKITLDNHKAVYAYSTPSISRMHHNYPAMKIFYLNKQFQLENFTTYYTSQINQWGNQHYQALNNKKAIFPFCKATLAPCLTQLSTTQVCNQLDKGLFYGVKSLTVPNNACTKIYRIN